jgi:putative endonuclease
VAWLYILECSDGSYYVGSTVDLDVRMAQHHDGEGCEYTAKRRPLRLVYCYEFESVREAYEREQ